MRSENSKIEKNDKLDWVLSNLYGEADSQTLTKRANQMVKKHVTKQVLANYLKEKQFSGFGGEFRNLEELSEEYLYDYARFWDEYYLAWNECFDHIVRQFPKKELEYAIKICGIKAPLNADVHTVRKIVKDYLMELDNDYTEGTSIGFDSDIIYAIYDLFAKWFFPNLMRGYKTPIVKKSKAVKRSTAPRVNVRRMF